MEIKGEIESKKIFILKTSFLICMFSIMAYFLKLIFKKSSGSKDKVTSNEKSMVSKKHKHFVTIINLVNCASYYPPPPDNDLTPLLSSTNKDVKKSRKVLPFSFFRKRTVKPTTLSENPKTSTNNFIRKPNNFNKPTNNFKIINK